MLPAQRRANTTRGDWWRRLVWERMKLVVEPSGAVSLAAVLSEDFRKANPDVRRICVVFSGGNVDLDAWRW